MSRLSFRPRPLDIHKKIPIVKSIKEFEDDDAPTTISTRNSQLQRIVAEAESEVHQTYSKKVASEIPTPQFVVVDTYERDYSCNFTQPASYLRGRGARAELGEFVDYDLDNEDEDWLHEFNNERKTLSPEKFESILFKLEVLDHKARERAGMVALTLGSPVPVLLQLDAANEALQFQSMRYAVFQSVFNYWKKKREQWEKPILRQLQPPPPVSDTNPYNVFRLREKAHRLYTRRTQRRENNAQSFEKLRQVRRNLEQAKTILDILVKREEKKREVMESEVSLQQNQIKYEHEAQLIEDGMPFPFHPLSSKVVSSEDEFVDLDVVTLLPRGRRPIVHNPLFTGSKLAKVSAAKNQELKRRLLQKRDNYEPVLLFTKPLHRGKLAAAGILPPLDPQTENSSVAPPYQFHGRIGRGGRIIFDRLKNLRQT